MLKGDAHYSPFMGDNKPLSVGLNPLGIRTASVYNTIARS